MPSFSSVNLTRAISPRDKSGAGSTDNASDPNLLRTASETGDADEEKKNRRSSFSSLGSKLDKASILGAFGKDKDKDKTRDDGRRGSAEAGMIEESDHEHEQEHARHLPIAGTSSMSGTPSTGRSQQGNEGDGPAGSESSWSVVSDDGAADARREGVPALGAAL